MGCSEYVWLGFHGLLDILLVSSKAGRMCTWLINHSKQAGLPTSQAFNLSIAQYGLGLIGTIGSWVLMYVVALLT